MWTGHISLTLSRLDSSNCGLSEMSERVRCVTDGLMQTTFFNLPFVVTQPSQHGTADFDTTSETVQVEDPP